MAVLITVNAVVLTRFSDTSKQLADANVLVIKTKSELQGHSEARRALEKQKMDIESSLKEERLKTDENRKEIESLKASLQVKKAKSQTVQHSVAVAPVTGNKASWLAASGIPEHEWSYVDSIVTRESGWNPNAVNKSSGACGLGQQLPCGKWSGAWNDPVAALKAMNGYVHGRYGSWAGAVAFWGVNHWY